MSKEETLKILRRPDKSEDRVRVKFQEGLDSLPGYLAGFRTDCTNDECIYLNQSSGHQSLLQISK